MVLEPLCRIRSDRRDNSLILMLGMIDLRLNLSFFALHTILIAVEAVLLESLVGREHCDIEPDLFRTV